MAIALGICLLKSRCCGGKQATYKITSGDKLSAFATKNSKYKEYLLQPNNQIEKGYSFLSHLLLNFFVKLSSVCVFLFLLNEWPFEFLQQFPQRVDVEQIIEEWA